MVAIFNRVNGIDDPRGRDGTVSIFFERWCVLLRVPLTLDKCFV
jgi:hypothetical protein